LAKEVERAFLIANRKLAIANCRFEIESDVGALHPIFILQFAMANLQFPYDPLAVGVTSQK
jgi:hypothetical protein